jgi:hypothetical protein
LGIDGSLSIRSDCLLSRRNGKEAARVDDFRTSRGAAAPVQKGELIRALCVQASGFCPSHFWRFVIKQVVQGELKLRGYGTSAAVVELTYRSPKTRLTSAVLMLVGCWLLAPLVFFVPPHIPWALTAIVAGLYLAYRRGTGEFLVHSLEAKCPNCGEPVKMKPNQYLRLPRAVPCFNCHHEPVLQLLPSTNL